MLRLYIVDIFVDIKGILSSNFKWCSTPFCTIKADIFLENYIYAFICLC